MPSIAYTVLPGVGGTSTFYRTLRTALAVHGWNVIRVAICQEKQDLELHGSMSDGSSFVKIIYDPRDPCGGARRFVEWCDHEGINIAMIVDSRLGVSAIPHFSQKIRVVVRTSSITPTGYRLDTRFLAETDAVVATSLRQFEDLKEKYDVPADKLMLVPHGIEIAPEERKCIAGRELRLGYVGRVDHVAKGALYIPGILRELDKCGIEFRMDIVGSGPAEAKLRDALTDRIQRGQVRLHGHVPNENVNEYLKAMQVLIMPSIFEGFGFSLVESMAASVVPVASRIRGVTDWIVTPKTGVLCRIGNIKDFAKAISNLDRDRKALSAMGAAARLDAVERFSADRMAKDYRQLFERLLERPCPRNVRSWDEYRFDLPQYSLVKRLVPQPLKSLIRRLQTA